MVCISVSLSDREMFVGGDIEKRDEKVIHAVVQGDEKAGAVCINMPTQLVHARADGERVCGGWKIWRFVREGVGEGALDGFQWKM